MITKKYSGFFKELQENNHKEWFHANKKRYEIDVKEPFLELLDQLLPTLTSWDNRILPDGKKALFRINRDIRFSKNKSPYHVILKAGFSPHGKKSVLPGYYLGIDAHTIHVGGGLFMLGSTELKKVRNHIAQHTEAFLKIISSKEFKDAFTAIEGEKAKRLDKSLIEASTKTDVIFNKQFYAMAQLPLRDHYNSMELHTTILDHFKKIKNLNTFLNSALNN